MRVLEQWPRRRLAALVIALILVTGALLGGARPRSFIASLSGSPSPAPTNTRVPPTATARPTATPSPSATPRPRVPQKPQYLVLIVLDGARPDYFNVSGIPHVRALMNGGTTFNRAFTGILESETPSGHASIGTGSTPQTDGILSFSWVAGNNTPVDLFSEPKVRAGDMERVLKTAGAPSIASLVHRKDPGARVVALSGHKYYAADAIGGPNADIIMYYYPKKVGTQELYGPTYIPGHAPPPSILNDPSLIEHSTHLKLGVEDHLAMSLAIKTFQTVHQKVTLINEPSFDWPLGHPDGANLDHKGVVVLMRQFDRDLAAMENAYRKAGVLDKTLFVVTADHGFAPISRTVDAGLIQKAVSDAGTSIVSATYHTAAYVWLADPSKANIVAENISHDLNPYIQGVYFRSIGTTGYDYLRASGPELYHVPNVEQAYQYLLQSFNSPNGPDIVVFYTEQTASKPGGQATWKGDHGGGDWEAQHVPLIFYGPGVRKGHLSTFPARLEDIAPTALALMGIPDTGMQGIPLAPAMQHATGAQWATVNRIRPQLGMVVTALAGESRYDLATGR